MRPACDSIKKNYQLMLSRSDHSSGKHLRDTGEAGTMPEALLPGNLEEAKEKQGSNGLFAS